MKIGVISDTHGSLFWTKKAIEYLKDCEYIVHCGDVLYHGPRNDLPEDYNPKELAVFLSEQDNIFYVKGNCDSDVDEMVTGKNLQEKSRYLEFGKNIIYAIHGYEETEEKRLLTAADLGANIVITGHTHVKQLERKGNIILLNPGSTTIPKDNVNSIAVIDNENIKLINLLDLSVISTEIV